MGHPVAQRPSQMRGQLFRVTTGNQCGHCDQAAVAWGQCRIAPDLRIQRRINELRQLWGKRPGRFTRTAEIEIGHDAVSLNLADEFVGEVVLDAFNATFRTVAAFFHAAEGKFCGDDAVLVDPDHPGL